MLLTSLSRASSVYSTYSQLCSIVRVLRKIGLTEHKGTLQNACKKHFGTSVVCRCINEHSNADDEEKDVSNELNCLKYITYTSKGMKMGSTGQSRKTQLLDMRLSCICNTEI